VMLLTFFGVWFLMSVGLSLLVGKAIRQGSRGLDDAPDYVSPRDWHKVTHVPHTPGFRRDR
jgi:hypothetical protein